MNSDEYEKVVNELHNESVKLLEVLHDEGYFSPSFKMQQKKVDVIKNYLDTAQPAVGL